MTYMAVCLHLYRLHSGPDHNALSLTSGCFDFHVLFHLNYKGKSNVILTEHFGGVISYMYGQQIILCACVFLIECFVNYSYKDM